MNGFGIPAGMAGPGYSAYSPLAIPATYGVAEPIPLAGNISALVSPQPEPVWFDVNAPLQFPAPTPEPVISERLPVISQFYVPNITAEKTGGPIETIVPAVPLSWADRLWDLPGNVVEFAGDVATGIVDVGKFIGEHLEVGMKTGMEIGGVAAKYKTAEAQLKGAEAAKIQAQAQLTAARRPVTPTVTSNLADLLSTLTGVPPAATPPFVEAGTAMGGVGVEAATNWPLLGLLGIGAYLLLKR